MNTVQKLEETKVPELSNENDPNIVIEIVELPYPGVLPVVLVYNPGWTEKPVRYSPIIDQYGFAHYRVPRAYAERLLANHGGRKYVLWSPEELTISVGNGRGGTDLKRLLSYKYDADTAGVILVEKSEVETRAEIKARMDKLSGKKTPVAANQGLEETSSNVIPGEGEAGQQSAPVAPADPVVASDKKAKKAKKE